MGFLLGIFGDMYDYERQLGILIQNALIEDVGEGDVSTLSCIPENAHGRAVLLVKEEGMLAGVEVAKKIFEWDDHSTKFHQQMWDGQLMKKGDVAFEVEARIHSILKLERLVLNSMQRMSGIATLTNQYVQRLKGYKTRILDTRKTTPNFRLLEKQAVRIGGGQNHRMGLYDMIMLKDNHIDYAGGIEQALEKAAEFVKNTNVNLKIEVETRNLDEVERVLLTGKADRVMLDNFSPAELREAIKLINGRVETEASGGINLHTIEEYAATGVDYISVGALIHQARSLDLSLKAVGEEKGERRQS